MAGAGPGWTVHKRQVSPVCPESVSGVSPGQAQGQRCKDICVVLLTPVNSIVKVAFNYHVWCEYKGSFSGAEVNSHIYNLCIVLYMCIKHKILHLHLYFFKYFVNFTVYACC